MTTVFVSWALAAAVLSIAVLRSGPDDGSPWGMFVDSRGRFSLTHMQMILWTIVVLSLIVGVFVGRVVDVASRADALAFSIPNELLLVMGISFGSGVAATAIKVGKDASTAAGRGASITAAQPLTEAPPTPAQAVQVEDGAAADQVVDITKFQNFVITIILVVAYLVLAVAALSDAGVASNVAALPGFDGTFVTLLGISHAGYLAGKIPSRPGVPGSAIAFTPKQVAINDDVEISAGGISLTSVIEVRLGAAAALNLRHASDTSVTVTVPRMGTGSVPVSIIAADWMTTATDTLHVVARPT